MTPSEIKQGIHQAARLIKVRYKAMRRYYKTMGRWSAETPFELAQELLARWVTQDIYYTAWRMSWTRLNNERCQ